LVGDIESQLTNLFDDPDFNAIHQQLSPFNLFEAVGAIRAKLRHSIFSHICYRRAGHMVWAPGPYSPSCGRF
jgi:hypothetical protein